MKEKYNSQWGGGEEEERKRSKGRGWKQRRGVRREGGTRVGRRGEVRGGMEATKARQGQGISSELRGGNVKPRKARGAWGNWGV